MRRNLKIAAAIIGGACMSVGIGLGVFAAPAPVNPAVARVEAAYAAMGMAGEYRLDGGAQARDTLVTLITKGTIQTWDPGQSRTLADRATPDRGTSTFSTYWDRSKEIYRTEWVRPRAGAATRTYTEIFSPEDGYVLGEDANGGFAVKRTIQFRNAPAHTMSGIRLRSLLREQDRLNIVLDMHDRPERLSEFPNQTVGGKRYQAVQYRSDNGTFIVMFDPTTKLPAIVRTRDFDPLMGDANFDMVMSDWRAAGTGGFKMSFHQMYTLNGEKIFERKIESQAVNGALATDAFTVPAPLRGKAARPAALNKVPFQFVLLRLASGFFTDSDNVYTDDGGNLTLVDAGPNMSLVTGGTHNTLIVATNTYLVAFDAPGDDGQSKMAIDLAKAKYPGKPFKYLVLTHHHIDHTGGLRAYVAEGATVVVGKGAGAFFRQKLSAPTAMNPHTLAGPVAPRVIEVDNKWSVNDGGRTVEAYLIETVHADGYLIPYVPDAKTGYVTDLWNPGPTAPAMSNPNLVAVVRGMEKAGVMPEKFAGGHGSVGNYADIVRVVGTAR
ncbi:MAG: MBL fold metallo-hydrolase [Alphaproteobacteria bacterium]|nr:MBL fold metallo-hydrolase [Alphaproteobacteria bacterium]